MLFDVSFLHSENCCSGDYTTILSLEAVYRYLESRRRLWNDLKTNHAVQFQKNKAKASKKINATASKCNFFTNTYTYVCVLVCTYCCTACALTSVYVGADEKKQCHNVYLFIIISSLKILCSSTSDVKIV